MRMLGRFCPDGPCCGQPPGTGGRSLDGLSVDVSGRSGGAAQNV